MFEIGEYVVCGAKGVCQIKDITHIDISGADQERLYYVLAPIGDSNGTVYVPTDSEKIVMRRTISKEEAEKFIRYLNGKEVTKERTLLYKQKLQDENLAPATINLYVIAVNRYLRYLECEQASIKTLKVQKKNPLTKFCSLHAEKKQANQRQL